VTETVHEVRLVELGPGETIESRGYTPDDILTAEDASYTSADGARTLRQDLLRLWVLEEIEVDEE
jgi:hypothetical protein